MQLNLVLFSMQARRSMRFAKHLRRIGDSFRSTYLNSTDAEDKTALKDDWRRMKVWNQASVRVKTGRLFWIKFFRLQCLIVGFEYDITGNILCFHILSGILT